MADRSAAHELKLLLTLKDQGVGKGLSSFVRDLRKLRTEVRSLNPSLDALDRRLSRDVNTSGMERAVTQVRRLRRESSLFAKEMREAGRAGRGRGSWVDDEDFRPYRRHSYRARGRVERADDTFDAGRQIGHAWRERADSLSQYVDETKRLLLSRERLRAVGMPEAQNAQAFRTVSNTVREIKGLSMRETTESMLDLVGALGDVNQAARFLPLASKYKLGFDVLFGDQMGDAEKSAQILNSFKSLEYLGVTTRGADATSRMLDVISQIGNSTGGRVTPADILTMLRRGKVASRDLSPEGLRNVSTLIEDFGAPTTGTALMSLYQGVVGGQMEQFAARLHQKYGLIDPGGIEYTQAGMLKRVKPGGHRLGGLLQEDPLKFADALTESLRRGGVNVGDEKQLRGVLTQMFPNRNAFALVDTLITQREQVVKESGRARTSKGALGVYEQLQDSPLMRLKEAEAEWTNFKAQLGGPVLRATTKVAQSLMPVADFFNQHPQVAEYAGKVFLVSKGFGALVETGALIQRSGISDWFARSRGEADRLKSVIADVSGTKTTRINVDSGGAASGVGRVKGMLSSIPSELKIGVQFLVAGAAVDQIIQWKREYDERNRTFAQNSGNVGQIYDDYTAGGKLYGGGRGTKGDYDFLASKTLETIKQGRALELAVHPERAGWGENWTGGQRPYASKWTTYGLASKGIGSFFDPQRAAAEWRKSGVAEAWGDPNVLAHTLRQLDTDPTFSGAAVGKIKQAISLTVPAETFANATKIAGEDVAALARQAQQNREAFGHLFTSTERLPSSFFRFGTALDSLSLRMQGINVNPPTFGGPPSPPKSDFNFGGPPSPPVPSFKFGASYRPPGGGLGLDSLKTGTVESVRAVGSVAASRRGRGGGTVQVGKLLEVNVSVPAGSRAAEDPVALAQAIEARLGAQIEELKSLLSSPDLFDEMVAHVMELDLERA